MSDKLGMDEILHMWMDSDLKVQLLVFFHDNPGVIETMEGLARRLGVAPEALRKQVDGHVQLGLLQESKVQGATVLIFNRRRESEIRRMVEETIRRKTEGTS